MGRNPFDTRERANNAIQPFATELNQKLKNNPKVAKTYTLKAMCHDFSVYLKRNSDYASSSMLNILKRNGLAWSSSQKRIITISELQNFDPDDYEIVNRIYPIFISVSYNKKKQELKNCLEQDEIIYDDILTIISVSKGLLILSNNSQLKQKIKEYLNLN